MAKFLKRYRYPYLFIMPFFILFLVFQLVPNLWTVYISLTEWNGIGEPRFTGAQNYRMLFKDYMFWDALKNTVIYWITGVILILALGLLISGLLNYNRLRGYKMNGNGMEKGILGQDSCLRGGGGLLEDLAAGLECLYLSDLRYGYCQSALRFVLPCLDPGRYSIEEWNRAAAYIMGTECAYPDSAKAREALVAFSREKAENGIYRSREEWYGNR